MRKSFPRVPTFTLPGAPKGGEQIRLTEEEGRVLDKIWDDRAKVRSRNASDATPGRAPAGDDHAAE